MKTALIVVDVQNDFCPGGALAVEDGDHVIEPINRLVRLFEQQGWPVYFARNQYPENHGSFRANGGPWPPHCIAGTPGAAFHEALYVPESAVLIAREDSSGREASSEFESAHLADQLKDRGVESVIVAGLATDYGVKHSALDAHRNGFAVTVVIDAVRALNIRPDDGRCAIKHMQIRGVRFAETDELAALLASH